MYVIIYVHSFIAEMLSEFPLETEHFCLHFFKMQLMINTILTTISVRQRVINIAEAILDLRDGSSRHNSTPVATIELMMYYA